VNGQSESNADGLQVSTEVSAQVSARGPGSTRRTVLAAVATGGATVALGGCAVYGGQTAAPAPAEDGGGASDRSASGSGGGTGGGTGSGAQGEPTAGAIARVSELPVGGGVVLAGRRVVLTRPSSGTVRAFSAVCTHAGCTVTGVSEGTITCPCHGSTFRIADGSVASGPATSPLPAVSVTVEGDSIHLS
jgi:Rieske Fe-S protein